MRAHGKRIGRYTVATVDNMSAVVLMSATRDGKPFEIARMDGADAAGRLAAIVQTWATFEKHTTHHGGK